jgi:hypothetical protein
MTCISALVDKGNIYLGADSAGVADYDLRRRHDSKIFINNGFIIGFTSSFRMGQLLRYSLVPPLVKSGQDLLAYMVTDFVDEVRNCFKRGGYARVESSEDIGGVFLVGIKGRLFKIESDFQVGEFLEPYAAAGCGQAYALGSLYSTEGLYPELRINKSLEAAEMFSAGVRGPFNTLVLRADAI